MSTSHTSYAAQPASRLLGLPAELRNKIYDFALSVVQDNVCIDLERGDKKIRKVRGGKKPRFIPNHDNNSRLSLLLTCRQINTEASGIAFSKMSMSIANVFAPSQYSDYRGSIGLKDGGERLSMILGQLTKTFLGSNLGAVPTMVFPSTHILFDLAELNSHVTDVQRSTEFCTDKCAL
jgi:hypothetical protein